MGLADVNQYNYQRIHDDKLRESICVAATVQVTSFDPAKMTVNVQPLSKHLENGKYESQPPILKVPVAAALSSGPGSKRVTSAPWSIWTTIWTPP